MPIVGKKALDNLRNYRNCGFGPRTGSKTETFQIPLNLPPGPLQELLPLKGDTSGKFATSDGKVIWRVVNIRWASERIS